jgi:hypothetical protein
MGNIKTIRRVAIRSRFSVCLFFGCGFDLYEGLCWGKFLFFKYNGLFDGQCSVQENAAENTISFIQKLIEMKPLHDPPDPRPARPDLHLACHPSIDSASIILRKFRRPGTGAVNVQKEARPQGYLYQGDGNRLQKKKPDYLSHVRTSCALYEPARCLSRTACMNSS